MSKSAGGRTRTFALAPCNVTKHNLRMRKNNPGDVSFRAFRLACADVLAQLERAERATPARRAELRFLKQAIRLALTATDCGDSMIYPVEPS